MFVLRGGALRGRLCSSSLRRGVVFETRPESKASKPVGVIEIEKKFVVTPELLATLEEKHERKVQIVMEDTYFDNDRFDLTTKDMWLRRRNAQWELKATRLESPNADSQSVDEMGVDQYVEYTDVEDVAHIVERATKSTPCDETDLDQWLPKIGVRPFGRFHSSRTRYFLTLEKLKVIPTQLSPKSPTKEKGAPSIFLPTEIDVMVDIDSVAFDHAFLSDEQRRLSPGQLQYSIGEVELLTECFQQRTVTFSADDIMRGIFERLGIAIHEPVKSGGQKKTSATRGKVLEYIWRFRPQHYEALARSGQLASKGIVA